jgi:hypothetical protein
LIVGTSRVAGKVRHAHVGAIGSIPEPSSSADRVAFWAKADQRLAAMANRLGPDADRVRGELEELVSRPTAGEIAVADAVAEAARTEAQLASEMTKSQLRHAKRVVELMQVAEGIGYDDEQVRRVIDAEVDRQLAQVAERTEVSAVKHLLGAMKRAAAAAARARGKAGARRAR